MTGPIARLTVGREAQPVIVIDDLVADPAGLRDAAARADFGPARHLYPGVRAALPPTYLAELAPILTATATDLGGGVIETIDASFSMVTTPRAELSVAQRLPHCDAFDGRRIAMVHYLSHEGSGGTAFYRHRSTGFETVDEDRRAIFFGQLDAELRHGAVPAADYLDGDSGLFERIALVEPRANRAVFYRSFLLHSGAIPADAPLSADPARGRLTVTGFFALMAGRFVR